MKLLKRKDSLTFKREKPLAKQERIYFSGRAGAKENLMATKNFACILFREAILFSVASTKVGAKGRVSGGNGGGSRTSSTSAGSKSLEVNTRKASRIGV